MTKLNGLFKRILAGGTALLLTVSAICAEMPNAVLAETVSENTVYELMHETTAADPQMLSEEENKYKFNGIEFDVKNLTLNGVEITEETKVKNGDVLKVSMEWLIGDQTSVMRFEKDLTPLVHLQLAASSTQNLKNPSGDIVGFFYIDDSGKLIIEITNSAYFSEDGKHGNIQIDGIISVEEDDYENGDPIVVQICNKSYTVKFDKNEAVSQLNTYKSADGGVYLDTDGKFKQKFDLNLMAQYGPVTGIQIADTPGNMLSNMSSITVISNGGTTLSGPYADMSALNAALAGQTLEANQSIRLQYVMEVDHDPNPSWNSYNNNVTVNYKNNQNEDKIDAWISAKAEVKNPKLTKTGVRTSDSNGDVEWTITLDLGDYKMLLDSGRTLSEIVTSLTDTLGAEGFVESEVNPVPTLANAQQNADGTYTWVCHSTIKDDYLNNASGVTVKNDSGVVVDGKTYASNTATVTLPGRDWLQKDFSSFDRENGIITWNVVLTPPDTATNVRIYDEPAAYIANQGSHSLLNDIVVDGVTVVSGGTIVTSPAAGAIIDSSNTNLPVGSRTGTIADWGSYIGLQDSYVQTAAAAGKSITITLKTKVNDASMSGKNYQNQVYVKYTDTVVGEKTTDPVTAVYRDIGSSLTKEGSQIAGQNALQYKIKVNLSDLDLEQKYPFVITDVLPEDLQIRSGSFKATIQDLWGNIKYTESTAYYSMTGTTATMTVPVTDSMIAAASGISGCDPYLVILYEAEVKDEAKLVVDGSGTYTNQASGKYGEEFIGTGTTTNTIIPKSIVSKEYNYNEYTAPDVEYSIEVNPDGLMLVNGGTLTAVDSLGPDSVLSYKLNTIRVQKYSAGSWINLTKGTDYKLSYDAVNNAITISGLPDGTYLKIAYSCFVGISEGELSSDNATNQFSLSGINSDATKMSNSINRVVVNSSGTAESELASIKLFKYWNNGGDMQALEGAKFALYRVKYNADTDLWEDDTSAITGGEAGSTGTALVSENIITAADGTFIINGLSHARVYKLTETQAPDGFLCGTDYYFVINGYTGPVSGSVLSAKNVKTFVSGAEIKYEDEKAETVRTGDITFGGTKKLGSSSDLTGYDFGFSVMKLANGASLTEEQLKNNPSVGVEVATGSSNAAGEITFTPISYSSATSEHAGTYYYKIYEKEIASDKAYKNDISIDENYYIVRVDVTDSASLDDKFDVHVSAITKYIKQADGSYSSNVQTPSDTFSFDFVNEKVEKKGYYTFLAKKTIETSSDLSAVCFTDGFEVRILSDTEATTNASLNPTGSAIGSGLTGTNNAYGAITFSDRIEYSNFNAGDIGIHYYKIFERNLTVPLDKDYKKDDTYYIVKVKVSDEVGEPSLTVTTEEIRKFVSFDGTTWTDAGTVSDTIVPFDNTRITKTADYSFAAVKTVDGAIPADEFEFQIEKLASATASSGTVVANGKNNTTNGAISFIDALDPLADFKLSYSSAVSGDIGTHYYKVSETTASSSTIKKDSSWYLVELKVENVSGQTSLVVTPTIRRYREGSTVGTVVTAITFNNLKTPTAYVTFVAKKTLDSGTSFAGKTFPFAIYKLKDDSDAWTYDVHTNEVKNEGGTALTTGTSNPTTGNVSFEKGDEFSKQTEPAGTHYYKIYESDLSIADANDYEKDKTYYIVKVEVDMVGTEYQASKTEIKKYSFDSATNRYTDAGTVAEDAILFNNKTKVKTGKLTLQTGKKTIDDAVPDRTFRFNVIKLSDSTAWTDELLGNDPNGVIINTVQNDIVNGNISFHNAEGCVDSYTSENAEDIGTHYYKVQEDNLSASDSGLYEKDPNYYLVKVTVSNVSGQDNLSVNIDAIYKYTYNVNTSKYVRSTVSATNPGAIAFNNQTKAQTGTLLLKKTITGLGSSVNPAGYLEFTITPGVDGVRPNTVYGLSDMTKSGTTYTKTIPDVPIGTYTVKETRYSVDGYILNSVSYSVTAQGMSPVITSGTSASANAEIVRDQTTTVAIEDVYQADEGSLTVSKKVTGGLSFEDVKNSLRFSVKNASDVTVAEFSGAQLVLDTNGNYSYTVNHLPSGAYTVLETCDEIAGYTRSTTYRVNGGSSANGMTALATVSSVTDANVVFTNHYEAQPIRIILEKTISGVSKAEADATILPTVSFAIKRGTTTVRTVTLTAADYQSGVYTKTITGLSPGVYTIEETAGDVGMYTLSPVISEVVLDGSALSNGNKTTPTVTLAFGNTLEVHYTNEYVNTSIAPYIRIGKSVKGDLSWDDIKDKISFRITDGAGGTVHRNDGVAIGEIQPSDNVGDPYYFELGADGNYYCTIQLQKPCESGEFNVTEICDMSALNSGYTLTRTYKVDDASAQNTIDGTVHLTGYTNTVGKTVLYTNTYQQKKGSLQIVKVFEGLNAPDSSNAELVKDILYTITPGVDGTARSTYRLADFSRLADGSYKLAINNIPLGTYMVTESNTDISGYDYRTTAITVTEDGAQASRTTGLSSNVTVKQNALSVVNLKNTYEHKKGELTITKTIKGAVTKEEAEGALQFTVKNNETGEIRTYRLTDFDSYDASSRKYTKTLDTAIGGYTVTETLYDVNGYILTECNYSIDGSVKTTGKTVVTSVPENGTTTVDFEDNYVRDLGKIVIRKTIKGTVTKEEAEGALQFTVKNNVSGQVNTYRLSDFVYHPSDGTYTKELDVASGGYTITESIVDINGYTLKSVTYSVGGSSPVNGKEAQVTVTYGATTTVDYVDEYIVKNGNLQESTNGNASQNTSQNASAAVVVPNQSVKTGIQKTSVPKTGDEMPLAGMLVCAIVALIAGVACLIVYFRRRKQQQ